MPLLQCWLDKSLSAGLPPLKRRSRASPLVNDLTHFFPLQSFHKPLLLGCRCYSPSPFPPSWFLTLPPLPPPFHTLFAHTLQADGGKRCLYRRYFPLLKQPSTLQNQHGINKFNMNWKLMKCAPPPLPPDCQSPGRRLSTELLETRRERGREWDHCHNYTIKSSSQQNRKNWPAVRRLTWVTGNNMPGIPLWHGALSFSSQWGTGHIPGSNIHTVFQTGVIIHVCLCVELLLPNIHGRQSRLCPSCKMGKLN